MELNANTLALSFGSATALLWIICSGLVAVLPGWMMSMMGHMFHANMDNFNWTLTWTGFFIGLGSWVVWASLAGWLIGWSYNRFASSNVS